MLRMFVEAGDRMASCPALSVVVEGHPGPIGQFVMGCVERGLCVQFRPINEDEKDEPVVQAVDLVVPQAPEGRI